MRTCRICSIFLLTIIIAAPVAVRGQQPQISISPDRILKNTASTVSIALDKGIQDRDKITVHIRGQAIPTALLPDGTLSVTLPKLDIVGTADVVLFDKENNRIGTTQLTYVDAADSPSYWQKYLPFTYILLIVLFPVLCTMYDIHMSYREREKVLKALPAGASTADVTTILRDLDQGPTGLTGLTRGLLALTLVLVLAIAAFHLLVFAPKGLPDIADKLLMLVAGTLTAITGFYFGSKAATDSTAKTQPMAKAAAKTGAAGASKRPTILKIEPRNKHVNKLITLSGRRFGDSQHRGKVTIDNSSADITAWATDRIEAIVPSSVPTGKEVNVEVINEAGQHSNPRTIKVAA